MKKLISFLLVALVVSACGTPYWEQEGRATKDATQTATRMPLFATPRADFWAWYTVLGDVNVRACSAISCPVNAILRQGEKVRAMCLKGNPFCMIDLQPEFVARSGKILHQTYYAWQGCLVEGYAKCQSK